MSGGVLPADWRESWREVVGRFVRCCHLQRCMAVVLGWLVVGRHFFLDFSFF
jgi:hypothetical protein